MSNAENDHQPGFMSVCGLAHSSRRVITPQDESLCWKWSRYYQSSQRSMVEPDRLAVCLVCEHSLGLLGGRCRDRLQSASCIVRVRARVIDVDLYSQAVRQYRFFGDSVFGNTLSQGTSEGGANRCWQDGSKCFRVCGCCTHCAFSLAKVGGKLSD